MHKVWLLCVVIVAGFSSGCSTFGYYTQAVTGHLRLMNARQPVEKLLNDEQTPVELREKLQTLVDAKVFAVETLGLPQNDSYSTYVETGKKAIAWNVVAAGEFSLVPETWCFPVAGCVSYRGYFDRADADRFAAKLAARNFDVTIGGASAYSTLGWFDDPILDTMLRGSDIRFVGTLFHELAHQLLYVKDDSDFNEAFASFVEQEGLRQWLTERGEASRIDQYEASIERSNNFVQLLGNTRQALLQLYEENIDETAMRERKAQVFQSMRDEYATLKSDWGGYSGFDGWFDREINNAHLIAVSTYRRFVPAFRAMYIEAGEDLPKFYDVARVAAELPRDERRERLNAYVRALQMTSDSQDSTR